MTIGDPYLNNTNNNSPTIFTSNSSPNTSYTQYNNTNSAISHQHNHQHNQQQNNQHHFNRSMTFGSSPLPEIYHTNREKFLNNVNSSPCNNTRIKRRNSDSRNSMKKVKQITNNNNNNIIIPIDQLTLDNINLEEYAKFNHPEGGIIQFTPIGNIRTFISDNNIVQRIIEKNSSFDLNKTDRGIDGYKLYLGDVTIDSSPSNEIENYMISGYSNNNHDSGNCGCCRNFDYDCDSDLEDDDDYYMH